MTWAPRPHTCRRCWTFEPVRIEEPWVLRDYLVRILRAGNLANRSPSANWWGIRDSTGSWMPASSKRPGRLDHLGVSAGSSLAEGSFCQCRHPYWMIEQKFDQYPFMPPHGIPSKSEQSDEEW